VMGWLRRWVGSNLDARHCDIVRCGVMLYEKSPVVRAELTVKLALRSESANKLEGSSLEEPQQLHAPTFLLLRKVRRCTT